MDIKKLTLLTALAQKNESSAMLELADFYYFKQNKQTLSPEIFQMVYNLYHHLASDGNPHAITTLGTMYYEGILLPQDFKKAKELYELAAEQNDALALNNLGYCYYYGRDIPKDDERAFFYFGKAAQLGHHTGMYKLGDMYYNGDFVPKDPATAFYWFKEAEKIIDDGVPEFPNVAYRIGHCYLLGEGVKQNFLLALEWLQKAEFGCYLFLSKGDAYAHLTLVHVKEDLNILHEHLDNNISCQGAELGEHNPLNF